MVHYSALIACDESLDFFGCFYLECFFNENFSISFTGATISKEATATISAKPQLRNTQAELTKLVPTALRVKRDQPKNKAKLRPTGAGQETLDSVPQVSQPKVAETATKDDAYALFMKEMQGLL